MRTRLRALARRQNPSGGVRCGRLRWEGPSSVIHCGDAPLDLGAREQALLVALMSARGEAVTRDRLHRLLVPDSSTVQAKALETVVHRVRKKLAGSHTRLVTLRGFGYLLREDRAEGPGASA